MPNISRWQVNPCALWPSEPVFGICGIPQKLVSKCSRNIRIGNECIEQICVYSVRLPLHHVVAGELNIVEGPRLGFEQQSHTLAAPEPAHKHIVRCTDALIPGTC